jgi:hypothetical protein
VLKYRCSIKRQVSLVRGSSKRQQPHRPQVSEIARYQRSDLLEWPLLTFLPLVHTEEVTVIILIHLKPTHQPDKQHPPG